MSLSARGAARLVQSAVFAMREEIALSARGARGGIGRAVVEVSTTDLPLVSDRRQVEHALARWLAPATARKQLSLPKDPVVRVVVGDVRAGSTIVTWEDRPSPYTRASSCGYVEGGAPTAQHATVAPTNASLEGTLPLGDTEPLDLTDVMLTEPAPARVRPGDALLTANNPPLAIKLDQTTPAFTLGRGADADIVIDEIGVSRTHARFVLSPAGQWSVEDLGSTNGTFVNGAEISRHVLSSGDLIELGEPGPGLRFHSADPASLGGEARYG